jgi:hypothetical protein
VSICSAGCLPVRLTMFHGWIPCFCTTLHALSYDEICFCSLLYDLHFLVVSDKTSHFVWWIMMFCLKKSWLASFCLETHFFHWVPGVICHLFKCSNIVFQIFIWEEFGSDLEGPLLILCCNYFSSKSFQIHSNLTFSASRWIF